MHEEQVKVIVDQRERNEALLSALASKVEIEVKTLPVGDYIVSDRVAIERKTVQDFESSIINGRLFDQAKRLHEYYGSPIIILEGDRSEFLLGENIILGAIVALYIDYDSAVILSKSPEETAKIIASIAKREQVSEKRALSLKGAARAHNLHDFQLLVVGNLPGVGPKISESLLQHFKSLKNLANASVEDLMEVEKIGKKKAEKIYHVLNESF
ncbi:MAG: ERCC4 domain-containing protein [Candidatus Micrarchaeia archaeon]